MTLQCPHSSYLLTQGLFELFLLQAQLRFQLLRLLRFQLQSTLLPSQLFALLGVLPFQLI